MHRSKQSLERLVRGAMGGIKADLIVNGGKFINVYSGEILDGVPRPRGADRWKNRRPRWRIGSKRTCHRAAARYDALTADGTTDCGRDVQDFEREIDS